jgi:hypothetical protein
MTPKPKLTLAGLTGKAQVAAALSAVEIYITDKAFVKTLSPNFAAKETRAQFTEARQNRKFVTAV